MVAKSTVRTSRAHVSRKAENGRQFAALLLNTEIWIAVPVDYCSAPRINAGPPVFSGRLSSGDVHETLCGRGISSDLRNHRRVGRHRSDRRTTGAHETRWRSREAAVWHVEGQDSVRSRQSEGIFEDARRRRDEI